MEKPNRPRCDEPGDPKLPIIHGQSIGNRMQEHMCPSPIAQQGSSVEIK